MKKTKSIIAMLIILCMVLAFVPFKAFAVNTITIQLNGALDFATPGAKSATFTFDNQNTKTVDISTTGTAFDITNNNGSYLITVDEGSSLTFSSTENVEILINGGRESLTNGSFIWNVQANPNGGPVIVDCDFGDQQNPPQPAGNQTATIRVRGGEGSFQDTYYNAETQSEETIEVPYMESYLGARFALNHNWVRDLREEDKVRNAQDELQYSEFSYNYDGEDEDTTVVISFSTIFMEKYVGQIKVNNIPYEVSDYIDYTDRDNWLDHYGTQEISFDITVPKDDNNVYDIEVNIEPSDNVFIGNFLWTSDPDQEYRMGPDGTEELNDDYVAHSKIQFVKVKYERNGTTYVKTLDDLNDLGEHDLGPDRYYHSYNSGDNSVEYEYQTQRDGQAVDFDDASMVLVEGAEVTLKIIPEYGYQVTAFTINGDDVIRGDNISEFTFTVREGNAHIGARVTKVDNDVKSTFEGITGGTIEIGDNEITAGTARLSVSDSSEAITEEKAAEFAEQAGDGYEISDYVDISLNQVFFKGTGSDTDVWQGDEMEDLEEEATISLEVGNFDAENTKILHNIHDGSEYEEVDYTYDETTKTLTFKTKSFSNYALATKTETETKSEDSDTAVDDKKETSPKTGDNIMVYASIFAVALAGMFITIRLNKKNGKVNKK